MSKRALSVLIFLSALSLFPVPITRGDAVSECYNAVSRPKNSQSACGSKAGTSDCGGGGCLKCEQCVKTCAWGLSCWLKKKKNEYHCLVTDRCKFGITVDEDEYKGPIIRKLEDLLLPTAKALYYGGLFLGFCFIVYSGYLFMVSEGNPQKTQNAQDQLTASILGIIFILLSAAILRVIINSIFGGSVTI